MLVGCLRRWIMGGRRGVPAMLGVGDFIQLLMNNLDERDD